MAGSSGARPGEPSLDFVSTGSGTRPSHDPRVRIGLQSARAAQSLSPGAFGQRIPRAELDYLVHSEAAATALAENYVGLPLDA